MFVFVVSLYDPDSQLCLRNLSRLDGAGIEICKSLAKGLPQLESLVGITLSLEEREDDMFGPYSNMECLNKVIHRWEDGQGFCLPTWRSLLEDIMQKMNLQELSQKMEDYLNCEQ